MVDKSTENKEVVVKEITPVEWKKIDEIIEEYRERTGSLIPVLQQCQGVCGYLPAEVQRRIAGGLDMSPSLVYGVVSFYSFFTMKPRGEYNIRVCLGTACFVKRSEDVYNRLKEELGISEGEVTPDMKFSVECVRCIGCCGLAPAMMVGEDTYGLLDPVKAISIIKKNY